MNYLEKLFEGHGAAVRRDEGWVIVDNGRLRCQVMVVRQAELSGQKVLQADFVLAPDTGERLVESIVGFGENWGDALAEAGYGFQEVVFHAAFAALLDRPCSHAKVEEWDIAGTRRTVTSGQLGTRGEFPCETWPRTFQAIVEQLREADLPSGLHWVRYFHQHSPGHEPVTELLLDNEPWVELHEDAVILPWPGGNAFYSVRLFFIIQDG